MKSSYLVDLLYTDVFPQGTLSLTRSAVPPGLSEFSQKCRRWQAARSFWPSVTGGTGSIPLWRKDDRLEERDAVRVSHPGMLPSIAVSLPNRAPFREQGLPDTAPTLSRKVPAVLRNTLIAVCRRFLAAPAAPL
ncbi:hypothetical protein [Kamptonema formosum]|uniref:hypothetical protein n=1 Tax=Kamptonema formosum TaxID=331992 RepID=UPI00037A558B|nr:hypothetical protein [Oscillatoria sp. PCC 10802]